MPKELTHWWLADRAASRLTAESQVGKLLTEHRDAWLIGAVLPDTLLHLFWGERSGTALRLAGRFHNPVAGSSYAPLIAFIKQSPESRVQGPEELFDDSLPDPGTRTLAPALTACLLGVASHMEADIVLHPFVYAGAANDIGLHYRIETDLDLWFLCQGARPPVYCLNQLLQNKVAAGAACQIAAGVFDPENELSCDTFADALQLHGLIQSLYGAVPWQLLAMLLALLPVSGLRSRYNLFYPLCWRQGKTVRWPDAWVERGSCKERNESPEQLAELATERIVRLLLEVEQSGLPVAMQKQPGENLLTGLLPQSGL